MLKDQTELISEKETTGKGILQCRLDTLGECSYHLKIRTSRLKVKKLRPGNRIEEVDYVITTMVGTITIEGNPFGSIYIKRNQLTLHLNEDFLMPVCAFPTASDKQTYKVYGRVVTQPRKRSGQRRPPSPN